MRYRSKCSMTWFRNVTRILDRVNDLVAVCSMLRNSVSAEEYRKKSSFKYLDIKINLLKEDYEKMKEDHLGNQRRVARLHDSQTDDGDATERTAGTN